jgi:hypothetical protein
MNQERFEDLNLVPPEEGFELYRYKNAEKMRTSGWLGKGTLTLGACSRKKPSRDTTRRPISLRRTFFL